MDVQAVPRHLIFVIAAIVCFAIALLLSLGVLTGNNRDSWEIGGFLSLALSFL
jgi:hypothetical protein